MKKEKNHNNFFFTFSQIMSNIVGSSYAFAIAAILVLVWLFSGPFFHFSDTWQLIINTSTTIITFLIVFLLQHTQNRDTVAIHLKLDELIRSMGHAHNELVKIEELSDDELKMFLKKYEDLADKIKQKVEKKEDCPEVDLK